MARRSTSKSSREDGPRAVLSLCAAVALLAPAGCNDVWGLNLWGLWPLWLRLALLAGFLAITWVPHRSPVRPLAAGVDGHGRRVRLPLWLVPALVLLAIWILFPTRTRLFGDSIDIAQRLGPGVVLSPRSPLFSVIIAALKQALGLTTEVQVQTLIQTISVLSGCAFLAVWFWHWRARDPSSWIMAAALLLGGYLGLFQAYVESYAPFLVLLALYGAWLSTGYAERHRWYLVGLQLGLMASHLVGILLWPSTLLVLWKTAGTKARAAWGAALAGAALLATAAGSLWREQWPPPLKMLNPVEVFDYITMKLVTLFDPKLRALLVNPAGPREWLDAVNNFWLVIGPALGLFAALLAFPAGRRVAVRELRTPLGFAALLLMLVRVAITTPLGAFLDWDLGACFALPMLFVAARAWSDPELRPQSFRLAPAALGFGILLSAPLFALLGRADLAARRGEAFLAGSPTPRANYASHLLNRQGDELARLGRPDEAARKFRKAFDLFPNPIYARRAGTAWSEAGQADEAILEYSRALGLDDRDVASLEQRGFLYQRTARFDLARADFSAAVAADSTRASSLMGLGAASLDLGDTLAGRRWLEAAIRAFRRELAAQPRAGGARRLLAQSLELAGRWSEAAQVWSEVLTAEPADGMALRQRGKAWLKTGNYARCVDDLRAVSNRSKPDPNLYRDLGDALEALGRTPEAASAYETVLRLDAHAYDYWRLASLLAASGRPDSARIILAAGQARFPEGR